MRFHWFLPFLRKSIKGPPRKSPGLAVRAFTSIVPKRWRSDTLHGKPGRLRRVLKKLGTSWSSSPFRRVCQGVCLVAFLWLFMVVCWPYSAAPTRQWTGWVPLEVNPDTGLATVTRETPQEGRGRIAVGQTVHIEDSAAESLDGGGGGGAAEADAYLGAFTVSAIDEQSIKLTPTRTLSASEVERLSFSLGPWTLHEKPPGRWPSHYADELARKEVVEAELFLIIDPLVSISTAIAGKAWVWSLVWAAIILGVCILIPRGFCGYLCPLGTLIDLFDWAVGKRVTRFRVADDGWWVHIKYYLLAGTLIAAFFGVLLTGFVAAIPVITRGMLFTLKPFSDAAARGWHNVPPMHVGHVVSLVLFFGVLGLGLFKPRFWCKYVCPSGAVFSVFNAFRLTERKVESSCIHCNKCVEVCPFDAIKPDFTTRVTDCTLCQTCGGVCPTDAIKFVDRGNRVELKVINEPPTHETPIGRRGFVAAGVGGATAVLGGAFSATGVKAGGAGLAGASPVLPVRPPGSVPEQEFLQLCIRCGECFKACPNDVLQPLGFEQGLEGLWTPAVKANWAGCEPSCNNCGQVCPTGAIRALPLREKKVARMGLAIVNEQTCLPFAEREACQLCVDECVAAGYDAIEFMRVGVKVDEAGRPIDDTGYLAPVVRADKCVGCGLCQTRCVSINVDEKGLLEETAILIEAGPGKEDRMMDGSYLRLRKQEELARRRQTNPQAKD